MEEAMKKIHALLDADRKWQDFLAEKNSLENRHDELEFLKMNFKAAEVMGEENKYSKEYFDREQRKLCEEYGQLCHKYDEALLEHNVIVASRKLTEVEIDEAVMLGGLEEGVATKVRRIKRVTDMLRMREVRIEDEYIYSR